MVFAAHRFCHGWWRVSPMGNATAAPGDHLATPQGSEVFAAMRWLATQKILHSSGLSVSWSTGGALGHLSLVQHWRPWEIQLRRNHGVANQLSWQTEGGCILFKCCFYSLYLFTYITVVPHVFQAIFLWYPICALHPVQMFEANVCLEWFQNAPQNPGYSIFLGQVMTWAQSELA